MIHKVGQIMLYVTNQDASVKFWIEMLGFEVIVDKQENGMRWIEIAQQKSLKQASFYTTKS